MCRIKFVRNGAVNWPEHVFDGRSVDAIEVWINSGPNRHSPMIHSTSEICGTIDARACPGAEALGWHDGSVCVIRDDDPAEFVHALAGLLQWAAHRGTLQEYVLAAKRELGEPHGVGPGSGYPVSYFRWMTSSHLLAASRLGAYDAVGAIRATL